MNDLIICPLCNKEFRSLATGHLVRIHNMSVVEFRKEFPNHSTDSETMLKVRGDAIRQAWADKPQEELDVFYEKMSNTMLDRYSTLTDEERAAWSERSRQSALNYLTNLSLEERELLRQRKSDQAKNQDLTKFIRSSRIGHRNWYNSMTLEEYNEYCSKLSKAHKARFEKMTEEELREHLVRTACKSTSKIEKLVVKTLKTMGFKVNPKYKVGRFQTDVYLPELHLIIEVFGDYWHGSPKIFNDSDIHPTNKVKIQEMREYDHKRIKKIEQDGYNVSIVWESDLYYDGVEKVLFKIIYGNTEPRADGNVSQGVTTEARI